MGYWFQKRKKIGNFNINFSKSGIGASFRPFKGFNIGIDSKGRTYISGGVLGMRYREYLDNKSSTLNLSKEEKLLQIIPDKYKYLGGHYFSLFFFFLFLLGFFSSLLEDVNMLSLNQVIFGFFVFLFWGFKLFFSKKAKQRKTMENFIYYMFDDDGENALLELDKVINLEKNKKLLNTLLQIKKSLISAMSIS